MMNLLSKTGIRLGLAIAACGVAVGGALAAEQTPPPDLSAPAATVASSPPAALASAYGVLRSSANADSSSKSLATDVAGPGQHWGTNASLARRAGSPVGDAIWLIPGSAGTCIEMAAGGGVCGPNAGVVQQGEYVINEPPSGQGTSTIEGIVPDGSQVTANTGTNASVAQDGNAFVLSAPANEAINFTISTPSGSYPQSIAPATPNPSPPTSGG